MNNISGAMTQLMLVRCKHLERMHSEINQIPKKIDRHKENARLRMISQRSTSCRSSNTIFRFELSERLRHLLASSIEFGSNY